MARYRVISFGHNKGSWMKSIGEMPTVWQFQTSGYQGYRASRARAKSSNVKQKHSEKDDAEIKRLRSSMAEKMTAQEKNWAIFLLYSTQF